MVYSAIQLFLIALKMYVLIRWKRIMLYIWTVIKTKVIFNNRQYLNISIFNEFKIILIKFYNLDFLKNINLVHSILKNVAKFVLLKNVNIFTAFFGNNSIF